MAEIHVVVSSNVGASYQVHNPGRPSLTGSAGKAVVTTAKSVGQPNGAAHGQVTAGPVFDNPA